MADEKNVHALVLAPVGRDGAIATAILAEVGFAALVCDDLAELVVGLDDAACAVVSEEALLNADRRLLAEWVTAQPQWSDFPFVLLTHRGGPPVEHLLDLLGNVTVLERPFHPLMLVNAVRSALRARGRQRETQAHIDERRVTQERQALLIRELHHRVKNTLATVQALLGATARSTNSVEEFTESFAERIHALANTHNLLTEDYWQTAALEEILRHQLDPYDDGAARRIRLEGPVVELGADIAVPVSMAIHELTTNAAKHGALSAPGGQVIVVWKVVEEAESRRHLNVDWIECGGPPVRKPSRRGFGSVLLNRVLPVQCSAEIRLDYANDGLRFHMNLPLTETRLVPLY